MFLILYKVRDHRIKIVEWTSQICCSNSVINFDAILAPFFIQHSRHICSVGTHRVDRVLSFFSCRWNWARTREYNWIAGERATPTPLLVPERGTHSLAWGGGGVPKRTWGKTLLYSRYITLFYTIGLKIIVLYVMVPKPYRYSF
jgi:hypothetical protein